MSAENTETQKRKGGRHRRTLMQAAIVVWVAALLLALFIAVFLRAHQMVRAYDCYSHVEQLGVGMRMFTEQHEGRLPDAATWVDDLQPMIKNPQMFKCPSDNTGQTDSYAMVQRYSGVKLDDIPNPAETIIIYEVENGRPAFRHRGRMIVVYADGHIQKMQELPPGTLDAAQDEEGATDVRQER